MNVGKRAVLSRRMMLGGTVSVACLAPWASQLHAADSLHSTVVETNSGKVSGRRVDAVTVFKGIPYGETTAGVGRFRQPRARVPWTGVLAAVEDPPEAPQRAPGIHPPSGAPSVLESVEPDWPRLAESEDCLKLDVWTPASDNEKRPVMVWFHGGGFAVGSAAGLWQDGGNLARRGNVVVVSVNHRLNVLGHLFLDPLDEQFAGAGNAGLLDLVLALTWVKDNIARFGGDPDNVTIFGQSGGGQKVSMLLAMPTAAGLFHKAIIQSGPAPKALQPAYAADMAQRLLAKLRIGRAEVRRLQQIPLAQIMSAYFQVFRETGGYGVLGILQGFAPVVDGRLLPRHPFQGQAPSMSAEIPLLIGTTRTEMTLHTLLEDPGADQMDEPGLQARLQALFGADARLVYDVYRTHHPSLSTWERYALITSDWPTRLYSIWIAEQKARLQRAAVFMYRTDWQTPVAGGKLLAPHAIDLSFALDDTAYSTSFDGGGPSVQRLSRRMSGSWLAFAHRGDPNIGAMPGWPRYEPDAGRATLLYDRECRVVNDPDGADRRELDRIMAKRLTAG